jgi:GNAT superfamily N-acetyltransferase
MKIAETRADEVALSQYVALFAECFPAATHYTIEYLRWLYAANPAGTVVGFDAWDDDTLAAHYVCVPASVFVGGRIRRALLSLNTATRPAYQGKGLFTKLAAATYEGAKAKGFECVYGVANANSTPGFVRKLGFQLVTPLDAFVGLGALGIDDIHAVCARAAWRRDWGPDELKWRCASPANAVSLIEVRPGHYGAAAPTGRFGIQAWGEIPAPASSTADATRASPLAPRLFLGLTPGGDRRRLYARIPDRLRPSPLNLIFLDLATGVRDIDPRSIFFTFLDFDAY